MLQGKLTIALGPLGPDLTFIGLPVSEKFYNTKQKLGPVDIQLIMC